MARVPTKFNFKPASRICLIAKLPGSSSMNNITACDLLLRTLAMWLEKSTSPTLK